ncbi:MAG TPA: hypothetical protein VGQ37_00770 [Vicinamibacterales bacterium]|jgi:hypothetical protein|nr:hypothetical protein [Vicinamibacterales bacterium]
MRRVIGEALMSMAALAILLAVLAALDPRIREHAKSVLLRKDTLAADVSRMNAEAHDAVAVVRWSAREHGLDHAALAVFVVVATGLVVAMLRL